MKKIILVGFLFLLSPTWASEVVLMNPFTLKKSEVENFLSRWTQVAEYMRKQPGFIESELHEGIREKGKWFNYAKWKSIEDFQRAVSSPGFKKLTENFPGEGQPVLYLIRKKIK